jgi:hypothetical protein
MEEIRDKTFSEEKHTDLHEKRNEDFRKLLMDDRGKIKEAGVEAAVSANVRTFLILGWVSAAFTALISPLFAAASIVFGILANKKIRGSGNAVIITSVVIAALNVILGTLLLRALFF